MTNPPNPNTAPFPYPYMQGQLWAPKAELDALRAENGRLLERYHRANNYAADLEVEKEQLRALTEGMTKSLAEIGEANGNLAREAIGMKVAWEEVRAENERLRAALDALVTLWDSLQRTAGPVMGTEDWQHAWRDARDLLR